MDKSTNVKLTKKTDRNYSMHTMTISSHLTYLEKNILKECLEEYTQQNRLQRYDGKDDGYRNKIIYYSGIAKEFGFNEIKLISYTPRNTEIENFWLNIKINPRKMFHPDDHPYVYIASYEDVTKCMKHVKTMLKAIGAPKAMIEIFKLQRIDFCVNINLGSSDNVKDYMPLLLKGAYSSYFSRHMEYSTSHKRYIPTKDSFTIRSSNIEFSIYDKHTQLNKEYLKYSADEIQEAEGLIRIELRVSRPIIYQKSKKYHLDTIQDFLECASEIAKSSIPQYIKRAYGTGRFTTLDNAKKIIHNSRYKSKTKEELIDMLELVSEKRSLQEAKYKMPDKLYKKCIRKFNELDLSPITIPRRSATKEYPNLLYYIQNHNFNCPN